MTEGLSIIVIALTIVAIWRRDALLHWVCIIAWLFMTFYMVNLEYPAANPYLKYAVGGVCLSMVLVMTVKAIQIYFTDRPKWPTSSDIQAEHKKKVLNLTKKRGKRWWEE